MNEVFITGLAQVSSLGSDLEGFWSALIAGQSGASAVASGFSSRENFPVRFLHQMRATEVALPPLQENLYLSENAIVARHLLARAGHRIRGQEVDGLVWGHGQAGLKFGNILHPEAEKFSARAWRECLKQSLLEQEIFLRSETAVIAQGNACVTGVTALGEAMERIQRGQWRRALVLVQELRCRDWVLWPYYKMGLLANGGENPAQAMRPFSSQPSGFVKGEGGACFLLESLAALRESGTTPYCRLLATAQLADGRKMFEPRADLTMATACVDLALRRAGVAPVEVDSINAHGSATAKGDALETRLVHRVFTNRAREIPVSTFKPQVGHLNTASAAIEILIAALMIRHQVILPILNLAEGPSGLNFVSQARSAKINTVLKLAFGFGWSNAAAVLAAP